MRNDVIVAIFKVQDDHLPKMLQSLFSFFSSCRAMHEHVEPFLNILKPKADKVWAAMLDFCVEREGGRWGF